MAENTCAVYEGGRSCQEPVRHQVPVYIPELDEARDVGVCDRHWRALHGGTIDFGFVNPKEVKKGSKSAQKAEK